MKKPYQSPAFHLLPGVPGKTGSELAAMDGDALEQTLLDNGFARQIKRYRANPAFLMRAIAGEALLIPTGAAAGNVMLPLSDTAAFIWRQLQQPKTVQDIICAAQAEYADEENAISAHIQQFIMEHTKSGLVLEVE